MLSLQATRKRVTVGRTRLATSLTLVLSMCLNSLALPVRAQPGVPAAVVTCFNEPAVCVVIAAGWGVWYLYRRGQPPTYCTYATCKVLRQPLHIDDPDHPLHSQIIDYVWGNDYGEAERHCKRLAAKAGLRYVKVRRTSQKGKRWECHVDSHPEATHYRRR